MVKRQLMPTLPATKMYDGKRYTKDTTRLSWSSLRNRIDSLRNDGWNVRYVEWQHTAKPRIRYTIYKRKKITKRRKK